jgi:hypothetical protein
LLHRSNHGRLNGGQTMGEPRFVRVQRNMRAYASII